MKALTKLIDKVETGISQDLKTDFDKIIISHTTGNYGKDKAALKSFLEDIGKNGCISGMISEFIYHADNKAFYIKHIDDLEYFMKDIEENQGGPVENRNDLIHYTFVVWVCFEEYCYQVYNGIFE